MFKVWTLRKWHPGFTGMIKEATPQPILIHQPEESDVIDLSVIRWVQMDLCDRFANKRSVELAVVLFIIL